jgi:hypothetical protein
MHRNRISKFDFVVFRVDARISSTLFQAAATKKAKSAELVNRSLARPVNESIIRFVHTYLKSPSPAQFERFYFFTVFVVRTGLTRSYCTIGTCVLCASQFASLSANRLLCPSPLPSMFSDRKKKKRNHEKSNLTTDFGAFY